MQSRFTDDTITIPRLTSFSDGVFAIAVTLLVFGLKVPHLTGGDIHSKLPQAILQMLPGFTTYMLTFLVIAILWTFHHRMLNLVNRIDTGFLWLNILYLLAISFLPFPAALFGTYPSEAISFIFYIGSLSFAGVLATFMLGYAARKQRLIKKEVSAETVKYLFYRQATSLVVFVLSVPVAFYRLQLARDFLFALFPLHWLTRYYFRKYMGKTAWQPKGGRPPLSNA